MLAPLVIAGVVVGAGQRVLTAGVIGANIGAGLAMIFAAPAAAGLVLWAAGRTVWLTRRPRHRPPGATGSAAPSAA